MKQAWQPAEKPDTHFRNGKIKPLNYRMLAL
jgi:hypothetical protein